MTQNEMILEYMKKNGGITQADAVNALGCYRLGARIWELKERGVRIVTTMVDGENRFGGKTRFARYTLG